ASPPASRKCCTRARRRRSSSRRVSGGSSSRTPTTARWRASGWARRPPSRGAPRTCWCSLDEGSILRAPSAPRRLARDLARAAHRGAGRLRLLDRRPAGAGPGGDLAPLLAIVLDRGRLDRGLPRGLLPRRVLHRGLRAEAPQPAALPGGAALLDQPACPDLRAQVLPRPPRMVRHWPGHLRHRAEFPAVHDPAALRLDREAPAPAPR